MPEGNSFNLGVSLRTCFGLPKTKNAKHFWFRANPRDSDTTPPDVDYLVGGGAYMRGRLWSSGERTYHPFLSTHLCTLAFLFQ